MKFLDYMPDAYEYGNPTQFDIGAYGWEIDYINSTFLEGWINLVQPVKAFTISRYTSSGLLESKLKEFYENKGYHTSLGELGDDIYLLCREEPVGPPKDQDIHNDHLESGLVGYWFFWFDCDVSDCTIGRFATADPDAQVFALFTEWVKERSEWINKHPTHGTDGPLGDGRIFELDLKKLTGWISF